MHDSRQIANWFIDAANEQGNVLTPMQLLKLVYIAHGWMLGLYGRPLIGDKIEAWKYGPVIPRLYHAIKHCKDRPVTNHITAEELEFAEIETDLLKQVYEAYGTESGIELSRLTHMKGTPWELVYEPQYTHIPISNDIIEQHYKTLAE